LLGLSAALVVGAVYELARPLEPVAAPTTHELGSHRMPSPSRTSYSPPAEDLFADINNRPIFISGRKALADAVLPNATTAATSDLSLVGVIMGEARAVALIHSKNGASTTSASLGDVVNGWQVARIDATSVTLRANGGDFVLQLSGPASAPPSPPLPPLNAPQAAPAPAPATPPPAAGSAAPSPATPVLKAGPTTATATISPPKPTGPPSGGTIAPEALKGAPLDPATGQPTL
jgi:hypothetical protein